MSRAHHSRCRWRLQLLRQSRLYRSHRSRALPSEHADLECRSRGRRSPERPCARVRGTRQDSGLLSCPLRSSNCVSSISASPIPMMIPPRNWLFAVLGLSILPQSNEPRKPLTRTSPVIAFTLTSANIAPKECIDQCIHSSGGDALASAVS